MTKVLTMTSVLTPKRSAGRPRNPEVMWIGTRSRGYLWIGSDDGCCMTLTRGETLRLARMILDDLGETETPA